MRQERRRDDVGKGAESLQAQWFGKICSNHHDVDPIELSFSKWRSSLMQPIYRQMNLIAPEVMARCGRLLKWLPVILLIGVQVTLFQRGYRQSADDAALTLIYLQGWDAIWTYATEIAQAHGRIGMYVVGPLNVVAAYWVGYAPVRVLLVGLYFLTLAGFARLAGRWLGDTIRYPLLVLLVAVHPVAFEHMPPNAYPLQNTLPFLLLLMSRLILTHQNATAAGQRGSTMRWIGYGVFFFALLMNEYAFVFGFALVVMECLSPVRLTGARFTFKKWLSLLLSRVRVDAIVIAAAFTVYLAYRVYHPSQYDGNVPDALTQVGRWLATSVRHVVAGTMLVRIDGSLLRLPSAGLALAVIFGLAAYIASVKSLPRALGTRLEASSVLAVFALSLFVVLPVASTAKQQSWCMDYGSCGFLDSRISYLWFVLGCLLSVLFALRVLAHGRYLKAGTYAVSACIAVASSMTFAYSWAQSSRMEEISQAWRRADAFACGQPGIGPEDVSMIDPGNDVVMHAWVSRDEFWSNYVALSRGKHLCTFRTR